MTKKGPLGKAEEFYVEHHYKTNTVDQIAKELDRPKATIKKKVTALKAKDGEKLTAGAQIARQPGIAIMTENASSMSDESKKSAAPSPRIRSCTTRITK
tara:strand:+ start:484 stop:780 length:297 start_codon:yes stop_codon:yes gene_type:complete